MLCFMLFVLCLILIYIRYSFIDTNYWRKRNIAQENRYAWHFLFGKCALSEIYKRIYESHPKEDYVGIFIGPKPALILRNLKDIQAVLQGDFQSFYGRGYKINPKDELANNLLLIDDYSRWRLLRQKITPIFTSMKLKSFYHTMERCASDFIEYIEVNTQAKEQPFQALHTYTSATISACVFGIDSQLQNTMESSILGIGWKSVDSILIFNIKFAMSNICPKLFNFLNLKIFGDHKKFVISVMKKMLSYRRNLKEKRNDFIDTCMELQSQGVMYDHLTRHELDASDEVLAAQAFSFFLAGVDTAANSMNFTLLELSNNPEILNRLHVEIDKIFDECNEKLTFEDVKKMEYLDMVVNESMRKYPPIGLMQRMCMKDTVLPAGNMHVKRGSILIIPVYGLHKDEKYFTNPEVFDPERFSTENVSKIIKFSYMPFSEGNRMCIGARFAQMQIKVGLAWLLRKYTLKGYNYKSKCFEPNFFGIRDSKAAYDLISRCNTR